MVDAVGRAMTLPLLVFVTEENVETVTFINVAYERLAPERSRHGGATTRGL